MADDINLQHFASDVDNRKLSNKQLAKKAKIIADYRNKEADQKSAIEEHKKAIERNITNARYDTTKDLINYIAKERTSKEGSFKHGGSVMAKCKLGKNKPTKVY